MNNENRLDDNALDNVAGGYVFNAQYITGADRNNPWEVIDNNGDTVARFASKDQAMGYASGRGLSTQEISWDFLSGLRSAPKR